MSEPILILDIETVPDPDVPAPANWAPEKILAVQHHKIVAIGGMLLNPNYEIKTLGIIGDGLPEGAFVLALVRFIDKYKPLIVTFNGRGFDLPVILARCLRYGIPFPFYYRTRDVRYRYSAEGHLDLMDFLSDFGATKSARLDAVAKLCGLPGKVGVDGGDVAGMVERGELTGVKNYCLCDVAQTAGMFLRMQLVRGEISSAEFLKAAQGLLAFIKKDQRLKALADAIDSERFLGAA